MDNQTGSDLTPIDLPALQQGLPDLACHFVPTLTSTQTTVTSNSLLVTDHQSAGVGRRGNVWLTPPGRSVCLSYRFETPLQIAQMSGFSLLMAVAILNTLKQHQADAEIQLKWPNDLYHQGAKFAGILINLVPAAKHQKSLEVIVGIGINWQLTNAQLASINQPVCNVPLTHLPARSHFIVQLIKQIKHHHHEFVQHGLAPFVSTWKKHDRFDQQKVQLVNDHSQTIGVYHGVNAEGELLLQTNQGIKRFSSGEVSLRAL